MLRPRFALRRFAVLALAVALVVPGTAAGAMAGGAQPSCEQDGRDCHTPIICCCVTAPAGQSVPVPPSARTMLTGFTSVPSAAPAFLIVPMTADNQSAAALLLHPPPHDADSSDLPIFLSTLLI